MSKKRISQCGVTCAVVAMLAAFGRFVDYLLCRSALLLSALVCTFLLVMLSMVFWHIGAAASQEGLSFFMTPGVIEFDPAASALSGAYVTVGLVGFGVLAATAYRLFLLYSGQLPTPEMARAYATTGRAPQR